MANYKGYLKDKDNNQLFISDIYSTNEQVIGTWINGKPLYRKVIHTGALPNAEIKTVSEPVLGTIDQAVTIRGVGKNATTNEMIPLPYVGDILSSGASKNFIKIYINCKQKLIFLTTADDRTLYDSYVILEYTKTTD